MKALIIRLRGPRTLRATVLRLFVTRIIGFAVFGTVLVLGQSALQPSSATFTPPPVRVPVWTAADAAANPGCVAAADWPAGNVPSSVVAHSFGTHVTRRVAFGEAWRINHNQIDADNLWVLGICR